MHFTTPRPGDEFCGVRNTAFNAGEQVTMKVYYTTLGMYVGAGEAKFTTSLERFNGKPVYHCVGQEPPILFLIIFLKYVTGMKLI